VNTLLDRRTAQAPRKISVSKDEIADFVGRNHCVANWLKKFRSGPKGGISGSKLNKVRMLCRFFKWLHLVKRIDLAPFELLDMQLQKRQSSSVKDRQWLLNLALEHSRDNPDFEAYSDRRKYDIFHTVKSFCEFHEAPLTVAKNVYGKKRKKKNHRKQITLTEAKKVLGQLSQRDRTILLIQLQSGMEIGAVLDKLNYMWHRQVKPQLDLGCKRMKIEFDERKATGRWYFTYISQDAIHELNKWLGERQKIVEALLAAGKDVSKTFIEGEPIFITSGGKPVWKQLFAHQLNRKTGGKVTSHMFRKLFKTEASIPDRAVDRGIVEFFMGHSDGIDAVGGDYDRTPEIHEKIFEKEYAKLEPFINIYSGVQPGQTLASETEKTISDLKTEVDTLRKDLAQVKTIALGVRPGDIRTIEELEALVESRKKFVKKMREKGLVTTFRNGRIVQQEQETT